MTIKKNLKGCTRSRQGALIYKDDLAETSFWSRSMKGCSDSSMKASFFCYIIVNHGK